MYNTICNCECKSENVVVVDDIGSLFEWRNFLHANVDLLVCNTIYVYGSANKLLLLLYPCGCIFASGFGPGDSSSRGVQIR